MLTLFHAFSMKCVRIQRAIKAGNDELAAALDRELDPLVGAILAYQATSLIEIYMQLQFMSSLIRREAGDSGCVERHSEALSLLLRRYFSGAKEAAAEALICLSSEDPEPEAGVFSNGNVLSDILLDRHPDRVAVFTRDYRYMYSNAANNAWLKVKPLELLGRHLVDVIGAEWFEQRVKQKLDACFSGDAVDYVCRSYFVDESDRIMRCHMTPLRTAKDEIVAALIVFRDVDVSAELAFA